MNKQFTQQVGTFGISGHLPEWTCFFQVISLNAFGSISGDFPECFWQYFRSFP
jgi:hypothetical protein